MHIGWNLIIPIIVTVLALVGYALSNPPEKAHGLYRIAFGCGLLVTLLAVALGGWGR